VQNPGRDISLHPGPPDGNEQSVEVHSADGNGRVPETAPVNGGTAGTGTVDRGTAGRGTVETVKTGRVDQERIAAAVREILLAVGEDPDREGLRATPARVARMYAEIFSGLYEDPGLHLASTFEADHDELVLVRDIPVYSMCEHHLLPWVGKADVAYVPGEDGRITGLSKLARLVEGYARRPQVQERLTSQVADTLVRTLAPRGVLVVVEAEHLCMSMRGVQKPGAITVTSAVRGHFLTSAAARAEVLGFVQRQGRLRP
jgi:GTP cyclohydrolase IA